MRKVDVVHLRANQGQGVSDELLLVGVEPCGIPLLSPHDLLAHERGLVLSGDGVEECESLLFGALHELLIGHLRTGVPRTIPPIGRCFYRSGHVPCASGERFIELAALIVDVNVMEAVLPALEVVGPRPTFEYFAEKFLESGTTPGIDVRSFVVGTKSSDGHTLRYQLLL